MLDIKYIRENVEEIKRNNASRNVKVDIDLLLKLDKQRRDAQLEVEAARAELKKSSKQKPSAEEITRLRTLGEKTQKKETELKNFENQIHERMFQIPNLNHESTPVGKDDSENKVARMVGKKPIFDFEPREHFEIPAVAQNLDSEAGADVSGARFYYLKGQLVLLERALMDFALKKAIARGFMPVLPPLLVKERAMFGTGFFPAEKNEIYTVNPQEDNLYLIGTSEVPLVAMHDGELFEANKLPKKYVGITPCFRREAGSYGKDQRGILRVHQFYKVEAVVFATPENSWSIHEEILALEEEILNDLGLHYQVVNICSGDLGYPAAKKYDCEAWMPGQAQYREMTSTSNTTDFQARRLGIKYKFHNPETKKTENVLVHTLNGTIVTDRAMLAILENYQTKEGTVRVPKVLQDLTGFAEIR